MTTSNSFIKQNFVLVVGLTLPVLLIVLFFVATVLPKHFGTPPQYDLLYTATHYDYQNPQKYNINFFVEGNVIKARITKNEKVDNYNTQQLMRFNPKSGMVQPVAADVSKLVKMGDGDVIVVEETKNLKIDTATMAPDGYVLESPSYRGGFFVTEIFGGYRQNDYRIKKGAVAYKIPTTADYYYSNFNFVGWVVGGN